MKSNLQIGDKVELLQEELLDNAYYDADKTKIPKGTIMEVIAITPKVRMIKGEGFDNNPYFLNLILNKENNHRVRTNFCNVKKIK